MYQMLNTLYVVTPGTYLRLDHDTLRVRSAERGDVQVPLHHIGAVVCFGNVLFSPALIHRLAMDGKPIVLLGRSGRFRARVEGPTTGNVLLRIAQYSTAASPERCLQACRNIAAGKIQNARQVLLRGARETEAAADAERLRVSARRLAEILNRLRGCGDIEVARGLEGEAARRYFEVFDLLIRGEDRSDFEFSQRSRRPPRDRINALLSYLYTLLSVDCVSAAESVGLDPQVGFLHAVRPGRPALGLDLMEELRPVLADRIAITLVNRRQVTGANFESRPGGAVYLDEEGRKAVIEAYQKRKQEEILHPLLQQRIPLGLVPHAQARLLARWLRGDTAEYLPYLHR